MMSGNIIVAHAFNFVIVSIRHDRYITETQQYSHELFSTQGSLLLHVAHCLDLWSNGQKVAPRNEDQFCHKNRW
jgi:hypothetical protein